MTGKGYAKMREGTLRKLTEFMETLLEMVSLEAARPGTYLTRSLEGTPSAHGKVSELARVTLKHSQSEETSAAGRHMRPLHTPHSSGGNTPSPGPDAEPEAAQGEEEAAGLTAAAAGERRGSKVSRVKEVDEILQVESAGLE